MRSRFAFRAARLTSLQVDDRVTLLARLERASFAPLALAFTREAS